MAKTKKKLSATESYWQLFGAFCITENASDTYSELIDRVNFFNQNQTLLKKIPKSATPEQACLLVFARRIFLSLPTNLPVTQFEYLSWLVDKFCKFNGWLQDNFKFYNLDSEMDFIIARLKPAIPARFRDINPQSSEIEQIADMTLSLTGFGGEQFENNLFTLSAWREINKEHFRYLHAFLGNDHLPMFTQDQIDTMSTRQCFQQAYSDRERGHYEFTWEGKDIARILCDSEEVGTLIPDKESSEDWDTTKNLYIEGDNLRALKLLLKPYEGKVNMIYIDPPYNTGGQFIYNDNFTAHTEIYDRFLFNPIPRAAQE